MTSAHYFSYRYMKVEIPMCIVHRRNIISTPRHPLVDMSLLRYLFSLNNSAESGSRV